MNLRTRFERFCYRNRDKGIPNLMLYITIGTAIVYLVSLFNGGSILYQLLYFDKDSILKGQIWRLFTYVFTDVQGGIFSLVFLFFFYLLGRNIEMRMGTLRFNIFYFSGVLFMDIFAMIFCPTIPSGEITQQQMEMLSATIPVYYNMAYYLHLSLLLVFATTNPDSQFYIFFVIPIKAWIVGLIYLLLVAVEIFNLTVPTLYFPHNLFPLVALANYLLFAGKDVRNLFPFLRSRPRKRFTRPANPDPISFHKASSPHPQKADYTHRCTICGRTDRTNPELEFRYCSRCNGYYCYCEDHINDHAHIQ